ncbi:hypothetical protein K440DRAFT_564148, partial [Wilcoxina mikolae CBS 423.85]
YRGRVPKRHSSTLNRMLDHDTFKTWKTKSSNALLSILGNPGSGKSVLAGFMIDHLIENTTVASKVAYFFCDDKQDRQKSAESLLRGLIHQLIIHTPELVKHAMHSYTSQEERMVESLDTLWQIFLSVASDRINLATHIIIDGMDESEERSRNDFLRRLNEHMQSTLEDNVDSTGYLKILLTSRPYLKIRMELNK